MFIILLPGYLVNMQKIPHKDLLYGTLSYIAANIGIIFVGLGLEFGDAGPVMALENQKAAIQTIITSFIL
jgi:uncharacterized membrane protein